jgi:hypothetical protein
MIGESVLEVRSYDDPRQTVATILYECVMYGESNGWIGKLNEVDMFAKVLELFNVVYVDDMRGTWKHRSDLSM